MKFVFQNIQVSQTSYAVLAEWPVVGILCSETSAEAGAEGNLRGVPGTHPFWLCLALRLRDCGVETEETMQPKPATEVTPLFSVFCCLLATNLHHNVFEFVLYCMYDNLINILFSCVLQCLSYTHWRKYCSFGFSKRKTF